MCEAFDSAEPGRTDYLGTGVEHTSARELCCQPASSEALDGPMAEEPGISPSSRTVETTWVWGLPLARLTLAETVAEVCDLIEARRPSYFITANTHYAMLTEEHLDLREINSGAAFILADGAPWSGLRTVADLPLKERVAGSDLIFELSAEAARKGYRLFLLGGAAEVAEEAARRLCDRYPGLKIVGTECPPFHEPTPEEEAALIERIHAARADILFVAFGQPKGERWIVRYLRRLAVPVSVQVGASLDFAADRIRRAPLDAERLGWSGRSALDSSPGDSSGRYARNAWFIIRMVLRDLQSGSAAGPPPTCREPESDPFQMSPPLRRIEVTLP